MSTISKQYEKSILQLENVRKNRRLSNERLNEIQKNCDEIREYINNCYIKHFLKLSL